MEGLLKSNKLVPMWPMFWDLREGGEMCAFLSLVYWGGGGFLYVITISLMLVILKMLLWYSVLVNIMSYSLSCLEVGNQRFLCLDRKSIHYFIYSISCL